MAIIYKFPSGDEIHQAGQEELARRVEQLPYKAVLHFLLGFDGAIPIIGVRAINATSGAELPPQLEY